MFAALIDDLTGSSIDELDTALAAAKARRDAADLDIAAITAIVDARQLFHDAGHHSTNGYLKSRLNCSPAEARRIRGRARLCNLHPEVGDLLGASRIGVGQLDLLADVARHPVAGERFAEFASLLCEQAEQLDYTDFAVAVAHFKAMADPDGSFNDQAFHEDHRTASVNVTGGAVNVHASGGDPIRAVEMKQVFDLACQAEFQRDCAARRDLHGDGRARASTARGVPSIAGSTPCTRSSCTTSPPPVGGTRPEPLVNIIIDSTTALDVLARHGLLDLDTSHDADATGPVDPSRHRCATSTGVAIHPDEALKAMIRGSIRRVIVDAHDVVINLGRTQRLFTGKARHAAQLLTVHCGYRGCDVPAQFCDIDHINEWSAHGGDTNQNNALPLCGTHDRWKHRQRLRGKRDRTGRIHLIKPDGTVIKPLGAHDPTWAEREPEPDWTEPDRNQTEPNRAESDRDQTDRTWAEPDRGHAEPHGAEPDPLLEADLTAQPRSIAELDPETEPAFPPSSMPAPERRTMTWAEFTRSLPATQPRRCTPPSPDALVTIIGFGVSFG